MMSAIATVAEAWTDVTLITPDHLDSSWQTALRQAGLSPQAVLFPQTLAALGEILAWANQNTCPLVVCGRGSQLSWGGTPQGIAAVVSTQALNQIVDHAVGDLTVTVEAGVTLQALQDVLAPTGQFLPLDGVDPETVTLGGLMATAEAGSWRQRYGGMRDLILGVSFVRADGALAKAGGRVVKNVAGYDLMKLFTGSYGTLGAIAQITFRTYPLPPATGSILFTGEPSALSQLQQALLASALTPTRADLLSTALIQKGDLGQGMGLCARFESIPESVTQQCQQLQAMGQSLGLASTLYEGTQETQLWQHIQTHVYRPATPEAIIAKVGLLPSEIPHFLVQLDALTQQQGLAVLHASSGLGKVQLTGENGKIQVEKLRAFCQAQQGFLTLLEAPLSLKATLDPWGYTGNAWALMQQLKQQFDPQQILSPGRLF